MYASDSRVLPIVFDVPDCNLIANQSLLSCFRRSQAIDNEFSTPLGSLIDPIVGVQALIGVVGVSCEGTSRHECV